MRGRTFRAVLAALAVLVVPASACAASSQFVTTKRGVQEPLHVRGVSGSFGNQELNLPPFRVFCAAARATGEPGPGYTRLRNEIKLSRCATAVRVGEHSVTVPARVKEAMDLFYGGNGDAELVNPVVVSIPSLKCTITIAEGADLTNVYTPSGNPPSEDEPATLPFGALSVPAHNLRDFPSGFQQQLQIVSAQLGLAYSFAGGCANIPPGTEGEYSGLMFEEAVHGNFEFVPGSEWNLVENKET